MKFLIILFTFTTNIALAEISNIDMSKIKAPSHKNIISVENLLMKDLESENPLAGGFNDLVPYMMPSPFQQGAGSCLYMSHTGIVEWWINRLNNLTGEDRVDLSERYYMALKTLRTGQDNIKNWRTDNIERLNAAGDMYFNEDYRFTKGWYKKVNSKRVVAKEGEKKAKYGTRFNWISFKSELDKDKAINVPKFKREVIHADANRNQWSVAEAPLDIVQRVKSALVTNKAPVMVIYNHKGFWHANIIFGFNDKASSNGCDFTATYQDDMYKRALEIEVDAKKAKTQKKRNSLLAKAKNFRTKGDQVQKRYEQIGGCSGKGIFYVRDSIYPDESMPLYDYDLDNTEEEEHLNKSLITREYEWLPTTLNHAVQILPLSK